MGSKLEIQLLYESADNNRMRDAHRKAIAALIKRLNVQKPGVIVTDAWRGESEDYSQINGSFSSKSSRDDMLGIFKKKLTKGTDKSKVLFTFVWYDTKVIFKTAKIKRTDPNFDMSDVEIFIEAEEEMPSIEEEVDATEEVTTDSCEERWGNPEIVMRRD